MAGLRHYRPAAAAFLLMTAMALTTTGLSFFVGPVCEFFGCAPFGEGREYNGARFSIVIVPAPTSPLDCYEVLLSTGT